MSVPPDARRTRRRRFKVLGVLLLAAASAGGGYGLSIRGHETTDDAFVDGTIVQISPQIGGKVIAVHVTDNQAVHAGDPLIDIDPGDYEAAAAAAQARLDAARARRQAAQATLDLTRVTSGADYIKAEGLLASARQRVSQARATADAAQADAARAAGDAQRYKELLKSGNASRQRYDQAMAEARSTQARWKAAQAAAASALAEVDQAAAQVKSAGTAALQVAIKAADLALATAQEAQAEAELRTARLNLSYTHIAAPQSGRVARKAVDIGDTVQKDQTILQLVVGTPWVTANFKETQLTRMRPGQTVTVTLDVYPGLHLAGHVDSVQPGTGARFSLLPPENATGNYVKVVQRVPVKIVLDHPEQMPPLAIGMSAIPDVRVGGGP
ncbi:MAG: HlyD family secretion protein [Magnetospirillum sp.]|nr:HlyD family secretion protein [Magnetospirillum sp.]